jgi:hypothetical protein
MHLLKYLAPLFGVLSFVMLATGSVNDGRVRRLWHAGAAVSLIATIVISFGLINAQRQICSTLGGQWIAEGQACRNEWGGNGNNDPGNGLTFSD